MRKKPLVIGIAGRMCSGKDTLAQFIKQLSGKKIEIVHMSDALKQVAGVFGFTHEQLNDQKLKCVTDEFWGITPRKFLQIVGTEMFRNLFRQDVWIHQLERRILENINDADVFIIADIRFTNEANFIEKMHGLLIGIFREEVEAAFYAKVRRARIAMLLQHIPVLGRLLCKLLAKIGIHMEMAHRSEYEIDRMDLDLRISNDASLDHLKAEASQIADEIASGVYDVY